MNLHDLRQAYGEILARRPAEGRADCVGPEALLALVQREGPELERLRTLDHAMRCGACRSEFELLRSVATAAAAPPRRPIRPAWVAVAAAVVMVVLAGVWWQLGVDAGPEVFRGVDSTVPLIAPIGTLGAVPDRLVWHAVDDAVSYRVEVTDVGGNLVMSGVATDTVLAVSPEAGWRPGTPYTWRVEAVLPGGIVRPLGSSMIRIAPR